MLKKDDKIFFRLPQEDTAKTRILRPGVVVAVEDDVCLVRLDEPIAEVEEKADAFLHFEEKRKFLQQSAQVVRKDTEDPAVLAVQLRGMPVSAETRQCFRVSCLGSNIRACVADEAECEVVDVSASGLAFYGRREYEIGRSVRITLSYEGRDYAGQGIIQSARRMNSKMVRYGVHCAGGNNDLAKSLGTINVAVQAEQLRRLARNS